MLIGITERGDAGIDFDQIDFHGVDAAILITKSPQVLFERRAEIPVPYIVHCTITGLGGTRVESGVTRTHDGPWMAYYQFKEELGPERTVLRVDPIICTRKALDTALPLIDSAEGGRVRISFADMYPHVCKRFEAAGLPVPYRGHAPLELRQEYLREIQEICPHVEICGEPGLPCTGCISTRDLLVLGLAGDLDTSGLQRSACCCASAKKEMLSRRGQCPHGCLYCYWR